MPFPHFNPVLFHYGWLSIHWYGVAYVAGILLGWRYAVALTRNLPIWRGTTPTATERQVDDLILWIALGIVAGGRLGSVLFYNTSVIWTNPIEIVRIGDGGMSFHGGLIGVTVALYFFSRANGIDLLRLADLTAPCVPIGLFFGRIANFVNGELWGRPTTLPWGVIFPHAGPEPRHPSQLYEAGLEGIVLFCVLRWATHGRKLLPRRGTVTGLFLTFYGLSRIALENVREPDRDMPHFPFGLTMGMMLSVPMVLAGLALIAYARRPQALVAGATPADDGPDGLEGPHDPMQTLAPDATEAGPADRA